MVALLGAGSYLLEGKIISALVTFVAGLGIAAALAALFLSVTGPDLHVDRTGIRGRVAWRQPVAASWSQVGVELTEEAEPQRFVLEIGGQAVTIDGRAWVGFADFVLVLASSPDAMESVSPAARAELSRLLQLDDRPGPS